MMIDSKQRSCQDYEILSFLASKAHTHNGNSEEIVEADKVSCAQDVDDGSSIENIYLRDISYNEKNKTLTITPKKSGNEFIKNKSDIPIKNIFFCEKKNGFMTIILKKTFASGESVIEEFVTNCRQLDVIHDNNTIIIQGRMK